MKNPYYDGINLPKVKISFTLESALSQENVFPECTFLQIETFEVQFIASGSIILLGLGVRETLNPVWSEQEQEATTNS